MKHFTGLTSPILMNTTKLYDTKEFNENFQLVTYPKTVQKATEQVKKNVHAHTESIFKV